MIYIEKQHIINIILLQFRNINHLYLLYSVCLHICFGNTVMFLFQHFFMEIKNNNSNKIKIFNASVKAVILYTPESWTVTLRKMVLSTNAY